MTELIFIAGLNALVTGTIIMQRTEKNPWVYAVLIAVIVPAATAFSIFGIVASLLLSGAVFGTMSGRSIKNIAKMKSLLFMIGLKLCLFTTSVPTF